MSDRFSPALQSIDACLDSIIQQIRGMEHILLDSFAAVADGRQVNSLAAVKRFLLGSAVSPGIPWVLYDTISALVLRLPSPLRGPFVDTLAIKTHDENEYLTVATDGHWQVSWILGHGPTREYDSVALDWYFPPARERAPIIPGNILDFIAGSLTLIRNNLRLPGITLLLIALESVLWGILGARGIRRDRERTLFASTECGFKILKDKFVVTMVGAERSLEQIQIDLGRRRTQGSIVMRRLRSEGGIASLELTIDADLISYLTSGVEIERVVQNEKGLAEAIQRSRQEGLLSTLPVQLDETLFRLRNSLVHLPAGEELPSSIPIPGGDPIRSLNVLRQDEKFAGRLVATVVDLINALYAADPPEVEL